MQAYRRIHKGDDLSERCMGATSKHWKLKSKSRHSIRRHMHKLARFDAKNEVKELLLAIELDDERDLEDELEAQFLAQFDERDWDDWPYWEN